MTLRRMDQKIDGDGQKSGMRSPQPGRVIGYQEREPTTIECGEDEAGRERAAAEAAEGQPEG